MRWMWVHTGPISQSNRYEMLSTAEKSTCGEQSQCVSDGKQIIRVAKSNRTQRRVSGWRPGKTMVQVKQLNNAVSQLASCCPSVLTQKQ